MTRTAVVKVALTRDERAAIGAHAERSGLSVAALLRSVALRAIRDGSTTDDPEGVQPC